MILKSTFAFGDCSVNISERPAGTSLEARTLLFLHGRFGGSETFKLLLDALGSRYRSLVPDLPGFNGSFSARERGLPLAEACELVAAIARKEKNVIVAGQDIGGAIAEMSVIRYPELFSGLVLMNSISAFFPCALQPGLRAVRERMKFRELRLGMEARGVRTPHPPWGEGRTKGWLQYLRACADSWPGLYERQYWKRELSQLKLPSLVLWGAWDEVHPIEEAREIAQLLPDSELHEKELAGHWVALEDPEWTAERIRQFVFRIEAEAGVSLFRKFPSR